MSFVHQIKSITSRCQDTLLQDMLGASALVVMLVVGLHMPLFI